jgi:hypothetical protein
MIVRLSDVPARERRLLGIAGLAGIVRRDCRRSVPPPPPSPRPRPPAAAAASPADAGSPAAARAGAPAAP